MEPDQAREIVEALLFSCDEPVRVRTLVEIVGDGVGASEIRQAIKDLNAMYEERNASFSIVEIAGGVQLLTAPAFDPWIRRLQKTRQRARLSRAALETLAIVAYRQPVTRPEVEGIRGVDCGAVFATLLERGLIKISGRGEGVGRPILYATTPPFLEHFGLRSLSQLPRLDEITAGLDKRGLAENLAQELGGEPDEFRETIELSLIPGDGGEAEEASAPGTEAPPAPDAEPTLAPDTASALVPDAEPVPDDERTQVPDDASALELAEVPAPAADADLDVDPELEPMVGAVEGSPVDPENPGQGST